MQMALIHDLAECIVGDITPHCGVPPEEKHRREDEAMEDICKLLGDKGPMILEMFRVSIINYILIIFYIPFCIYKSVAQFISLLFSLKFDLQEYEKQESQEAKYVKDLDRLDLIMQAYEYEKRDNVPGELEEFFVATNGKIRHPFINKIACEITARREALCHNSASSK